MSTVRRLERDGVLGRAPTRRRTLSLVPAPTPRPPSRRAARVRRVLRMAAAWIGIGPTP